MTNNTYTIFAKWPGDDEAPTHPGAVHSVIEEIDVVASSEAEAIALAKIDLTEGYIPGWVIVKVERREGIFC